MEKNVKPFKKLLNALFLMLLKDFNNNINSYNTRGKIIEETSKISPTIDFVNNKHFKSNMFETIPYPGLNRTSIWLNHTV